MKPAIFTVESTSSVLDETKARFLAGELPVWASVFSPLQTAGRGQYGRVWQSPAGNVYGAIRLPKVPPFATTAAAAAVTVVIVRTLRQFGWEAAMKWPNDLVVMKDGLPHKAGGILLEGRGAYLAAGIGLNLRAAPPVSVMRAGAVLPPAALADCQGPAVIPDALTLWTALAENFAALDLDAFAQTWQSEARTLMLWRDERVTLTADGAPALTGVFFDIGPAGELMLETDEGLKACVSGSLAKAV